MALGRGLEAILEEVGEAYASELADTENLSSSRVQELVEDIEVSLVDPNPYQPRKHFDEAKLLELSDSIKKHGLLQPVVVVAMDDRYILVAGERRLRAHKLAMFTHIKAIVASVEFDEIKMRELALIENIQRENLNPIELAHSYQELIAVHNITHESLSKIVYKSRSQITNTIRLLLLDNYAQEALANKKISQGHAKILVGLDRAKQKIVVDTITGQKLSVREVENIVKNTKKGTSAVQKQVKKSYLIESADIGQIEDILPFQYKIKKGSIEIMLQNEEELTKFIHFLKSR